jgi:hypothetical protein
LTVHRRRLHLLPLLDKINDDDDDKQQITNLNDKQNVHRILFFFLITEIKISI